MKIWILVPNENWIVDEMAKQFRSDNPEICTNDIDEADIIWAMADWCFDRIPFAYLQSGKPIVTMLHHFVPEKFDSHAKKSFELRNRYTTIYTAPNYRTRNFAIENGLTDKPIYVVPYWIHSNSWKRTGEKNELRRKYGIPEDAYVVGSFQRDTEGHDLKSPKLEKGPDLFCDFIENEHPPVNPFVILAGWRRQYVISRLEKAGISYKYLELPSQETVNDLYQTLDLYAVCSRHEGGPQALGEAGALGIPVVSRPVGMAEMVLPNTAINEDVWKATPTVPIVDDLMTPHGYERHVKILESVIK